MQVDGYHIDTTQSSQLTSAQFHLALSVQSAVYHTVSKECKATLAKSPAEIEWHRFHVILNATNVRQRDTA